MESDIWNGWRCNNECDVNGLWFGGSQNEPLQTPFNRSTPERRKLLYNSFNLETFIKYKPRHNPRLMSIHRSTDEEKCQHTI